MPTPTKGPRLGGSPQHQRLLLSNLATALFEHGRITTTQAKAKALRPVAERLITFAKRGDIHARRQVLTVVRDKGVVHTLFAEIGPRFAERPGGYTRITKIGPRKGDNAPMAVIELVEGKTIAQVAVGEAEKARGTRFVRRRGGKDTGAGATATGTAATSAGSVEEALGGDTAEDTTAAAATSPGDDATAAGDDATAGGDDTAATTGEATSAGDDATASGDDATPAGDAADTESGAGNQAEQASDEAPAEGERDE